MKKSDFPSLHKIVIEKYKSGNVTIEVNRSYALLEYYRVTNNPLVKLFHLIVLMYSFPPVIVSVSIILIILQQYMYVFYYYAGLFVLLAAESYLLRIITINSALNDSDTFNELHAKGIIKIYDIIQPAKVEQGYKR